MILKIGSETTTSNGAVWDEFSEQHQHQKNICYTLFALVQKRCKSNANFGWVRTRTVDIIKAKNKNKY